MDLQALNKADLHALADRLLVCDDEALQQCIEFFESESLGVWHGRARAMMARRFKHCSLTRAQATRLIGVILERFVQGRFSEQFKDQLRLALHLDADKVVAAARGCKSARLEHVRRYAEWILSSRNAGN